MLTRHTVAGALAIALAVFSAPACGGVIDPTQNVVETFTNTVPVGGFNFNPFTISKTGEFSITFVSLSPSASVFVAISLGSVVSNTCAPLSGLTNTLSTPGHTVLNGPVRTKGTYCVRVDDLGNFTVPETYTVTVSHP